ncbi:MAG: hypothetical protein KDC88_14475, partial [Ignavibacteriae bacterium]|nr:hypothetical protein [Ignavibacteriota bacterium]
MKTLETYFKLVMILISTNNLVFTQNYKVPIKFWGLQSINGIIGVEGEYKTQKMKLRSDYSDNLKSSILVGQIGLNTQSYFYHPNLISLETEMEYNPGTQKDVYLVIPDRSDVNTGERARGLITFLRTQPVIVSGNVNYAHLYTNREYATNIESFNTGFGGGIRYRNSFAPISVSYQNEKIDQRELQTKRKYLTERQNVRINSEASFWEKDNNRFTYTFDDYKRQYYSNTKIESKISSFSLNSNVNFDSSNTNTLSSNIYYSLNSGDIEYNRLQINENLYVELQSNFNYSGNYNFFNFDQNRPNTKQHTITNKLEHELYKSLRTHLFYEYINSSQTFSNEYINTVGIGISYTKKIPFGV